MSTRQSQAVSYYLSRHRVADTSEELSGQLVMQPQTVDDVHASMKVWLRVPSQRPQQLEGQHGVLHNVLVEPAYYVSQARSADLLDGETCVSQVSPRRPLLFMSV